MAILTGFTTPGQPMVIHPISLRVVSTVPGKRTPAPAAVPAAVPAAAVGPTGLVGVGLGAGAGTVTPGGGGGGGGGGGVLGPVIAGAGTVLTALGVGAGTVATLGGLAAGGYGIYSALKGSGNGRGVSGGGPMTSTALIAGGMYGIAGPGVPEPADGTWTSRWDIAVNSRKYGGTWRVYFWQMVDGYTICYNPRTGGWKRWKARKNIVLSSDPRISDVARAVRATEGKLKRLAKKTKRLQYKN